MGFCSNCGTPIDGATTFCPNCGQRVSVVVRVQQQQPFMQPFSQETPKPFKPNSGMGLAIFTTLCCCAIFGGYAMILANKVDDLYYSGQYKEAEMKAADSKKWSIIGIVLACIIYFLLIGALIIIMIISDGEVFTDAFWEGFWNAFFENI